MKIFATVGSTRYDSLFVAIEKALTENDEAIFQIADGEYTNPSVTIIKFVADIHNYYQDADLIITHAGAGSVYNLLEMGKKIIVVQNTERLDPHQSDLVRFVASNNYGLGCYEPSEVIEKIQQSHSFTPKTYQKNEFFKTKEICKSLKLL